MTQKHIILIVLLGLWGFLHNAMTSFDQTAVRGSSALQRGEDNPHKQRNSPLRESLQTLTQLVFLVLLHLPQKNSNIRAHIALPVPPRLLESASSTSKRWHRRHALFFLTFLYNLITSGCSDAAMSAGPRSLCAGGTCAQRRSPGQHNLAEVWSRDQHSHSDHNTTGLKLRVKPYQILQECCW